MSKEGKIQSDHTKRLQRYLNPRSQSKLPNRPHFHVRTPQHEITTPHTASTAAPTHPELSHQEPEVFVNQHAYYPMYIQSTTCSLVDVNLYPSIPIPIPNAPILACHQKPISVSLSHPLGEQPIVPHIEPCPSLPSPQFLSPPKSSPLLFPQKTASPLLAVSLAQGIPHPNPYLSQQQLHQLLLSLPRKN